MKSPQGPLVLFLSLVLAFVGFAGQGRAGVGQGAEFSLADADVIFVGVADDDWAGYSTSPAGDVNGDGLADILVGAPLAGNKIPGDPPKGEGKAYLILGRPEGEWPANPFALSQSDASFLGCQAPSMSGRQNYAAGDVNGDGYDDFVVSGWKCGPSYTGKAYLFLGRANVDWGQDFPVEQADASFLGEAQSDNAGYYVSTAGDVNGDGFDDLVITAPQNSEVGYKAGEVYLILGRAEADWGHDYPLAQADASFRGEAGDDRAGRSATRAGDVDGDGLDDILIGALYSDDGAVDAGEGYLILGREAADWGTDYSLALADASFVGEAEGDEAGRRVAGAGDVNGDGYDDILMGASRAAEGGFEAGKAYLVLGRAAADWGSDYPLSQADASFVGEHMLDQAGRRVSAAGDVNADGFGDLLIGAPHNDRGGESAGTAYLLYGRPGAGWGQSFYLGGADLIYVGESDFDNAGYDVASAGDVDGDGVDDFMVGAFGGRELGETPGKAYLLLSDAGPMPVRFTSDAPNGKVGEWHSFSGRYEDPNGWQDIASTQLVLGKGPSDRRALNVLYESDGDSLYLRNRDGTGWLGPCAPGQAIRLNNGVVQLDCSLSAVSNDGQKRLEVTWRARWLRPITRQLVMGAYLGAVDQAGDDSGLLKLGSWTLLPAAP